MKGEHTAKNIAADNKTPHTLDLDSFPENSKITRKPKPSGNMMPLQKYATPFSAPKTANFP